MFTSSPAWLLFTRLGEAQILLPAMAAALAWLLLSPPTRPLAARWLLGTGAAALLTTASKIAFIGWFVGYAPLDYTGISGHAMFAAAVLPVLACLAAPRRPRSAVAAGVLLAAAIAVSRVVTHAHSPSEAVLGFVLGSAASLWALRRSQPPRQPAPAWLAVALVAWLLLLPAGAPPSRTHDWVTQLSLRVSGHSVPYTRHDLRRHASHRAALPGLGLPAAEMQRQPVPQR